MALSYAFDTSKGETPETVERRRRLAEAIMGRSMSPRNVGEGFGAIANGIVAAVNNNRANTAEQQGQASASEAIANLITGRGVGSGPSSAASAASSLASSSPATQTSFSGSQEDFVASIMPGAMEASRRTGIDPRIIVAQAALESGWGKHAPGNNLFGIKSHGRGGGQELWTTEEVNGQNVRVRDSFRTYDDPSASISGYADFMLDNPRYRPLMQAQGLDAQLQALGQSGYATDSGYAGKVGAIARGLNLPDMGPTQVASLDPNIGVPEERPPATLPPLGPPANQAAQAPVPSAVAPTLTQQLAQGPSLEELLMTAQNPWLNDGQRSILNTMIEQEMQKQDPAYQMGMEKAGLELDKMRREAGRPNLTSAGGQLYNEDTGQWIAPPAPPAEFDFVQLDDGTFVRTDATSGAMEPLGNFAAPSEPDMTSAMQNYQFLISQGVPAEQAMERAFSGGVTVNTGSEVGTIPTGYELVTDPTTGARRMQLIEGGPAWQDVQAAEQAAGAAGDQTARTANIVREDIDRIRDLVTNAPWHNPAVGFGSGLMQLLEGSNATNTAALAETVKANIGFDRLQAMREASPTGGALGNVTERELTTLQAVMGNLSQSQGVDQFLYNLDRLGEVYDEILRKAAAYPNAAQFGFSGAAPAQTPANPEVVDFTDYFNQ